MSGVARTFAAVLALSAVASVGTTAAGQASSEPLTTITFDRPNVNYEGGLYAAVRGALDKDPAASFDVVAVIPSGSTPGGQALAATAVRRNAESVVRSLTNMGLSGSRIRVSQTTSASTSVGQVQVYAR